MAAARATGKARWSRASKARGAVQQADWSVASPTPGRGVGAAIDDAVGLVWLVAHSFGCLAAVAALASEAIRKTQVAGMLLWHRPIRKGFGPRGPVDQRWFATEAKPPSQKTPSPPSSASASGRRRGRGGEQQRSLDAAHGRVRLGRPLGAVRMHRSRRAISMSSRVTAHGRKDLPCFRAFAAPHGNEPLGQFEAVDRDLVVDTASVANGCWYSNGLDEAPIALFYATSAYGSTTSALAIAQTDLTFFIFSTTVAMTASTTTALHHWTAIQRRSSKPRQRAAILVMTYVATAIGVPPGFTVALAR